MVGQIVDVDGSGINIKIEVGNVIEYYSVGDDEDYYRQFIGDYVLVERKQVKPLIDDVKKILFERKDELKGKEYISNINEKRTLENLLVNGASFQIKYKKYNTNVEYTDYMTNIDADNKILYGLYYTLYDAKYEIVVKNKVNIKWEQSLDINIIIGYLGDMPLFVIEKDIHGDYFLYQCIKTKSEKGNDEIVKSNIIIENGNIESCKHDAMLSIEI